MTTRISRMVMIGERCLHRRCKLVGEDPIKAELLTQCIYTTSGGAQPKLHHINERKTRTSPSTLVLDDTSDESTILDCSPEHFGDGFLFENAFLLSLDRQTDVNCAAFCR